MTLGLTDSEVKDSRIRNGSNELKKSKNNTFIKLLLESLSDPIIKILLIALSIKIVFLFKNFDWYETLGILIAIFLASFISSISEYGSNKAFERLQKESEDIKVKVYRNNLLKEISISQIVVGDIVKISSGDRIPADGHIIKGDLFIDESFISGETAEVYKKMNDKVFSSSVVYKGNCLIKIDYVGDKTIIGKLSRDIQIKNDDSPLKERLRVLAKQISKLGYFGAILSSVSYLFMQIVVKNNFNYVAIIETIKNFPLMMDYLIYCLTLSVTIIIMAVPEGLPMMITLVLSSNTKKMLKDNVLVRRLVGIETSGSLNILLCDKTGTLTEGKLKVTKIITKDNKIFKTIDEIKKYTKYYNVLLKSMSLNNESEITNNDIIGGNSTDKSILEFIKKYYVKFKKNKQQLFDSKTKYSCVTDDNNITYYKGACEVLLPMCNKYLSIDGSISDFSYKDYTNNTIKKYTQNGNRVLLQAFKYKNDMVFISLIIIEDELRKETIDSVKLIQNAGIRVVMITGDSKDTALSIGRRIGITDSDSIIMTHNEFIELSDEKLLEISDNISIIARALPEDKSRLATIYKKKNLVVGMTGDGVNDTLALKKSDVGFAMGSGQEVAKEASDIVILDDNISSICKAILYGRTIFKSIRKFIIYQLTVNMCALCLSVIGTLIGITTPITIIQMLWLNMIMDTFAGLAFSYEPPLKEYMEEKSKDKNEKIMNKYMINEIVFNGLYSCLLCILFYKLPIIKSLFNTNREILTGFFALFIFLGINNSFLARTHRLNIFAHLLKNKIFMIINIFIFIAQLYIIYNGGDLFRTFGLSIKQLLFIILLSLTIFPFDFIRKEILKIKKESLGV